MFAVAYWGGDRFGWIKGDGRFGVRTDAIKQIVAATNASHRAGATPFQMKVVDA